jgi:hypothetical protein
MHKSTIGGFLTLLRSFGRSPRQHNSNNEGDRQWRCCARVWSSSGGAGALRLDAKRIGRRGGGDFIGDRGGLRLRVHGQGHGMQLRCAACSGSTRAWGPGGGGDDGRAQRVGDWKEGRCFGPNWAASFGAAALLAGLRYEDQTRTKQHRAENGGARGASLDFQRCAAQERKGWGGRKIKFFCIFKKYKQLNSTTNLNLSNQKQCTSMNATINSYNSLI